MCTGRNCNPSPPDGFHDERLRSDLHDVNEFLLILYEILFARALRQPAHSSHIARVPCFAQKHNATARLSTPQTLQLKP